VYGKESQGNGDGPDWKSCIASTTLFVKYRTLSHLKKNANVSISRKTRHTGMLQEKNIAIVWKSGIK
jgi:hypothetical protein